MAVAPIRFDPECAIELVLYVAAKLRYPTFHSVSKILYFADREHLSRYGSLLSGDSYVAMKHGPVPSVIYNLLKAAAGRRESWISPRYFEVAEKAIIVESNFRLRALRAPKTELLSASQRECLDVSLRENGRLSFIRLTAKSHDAAWKSTDENEIIDVRTIAKTLRNAKDVLAYLNG
ncbi:MAG: hypothetical protein A3I63_04365 [Betaproteobacteria bacterium RIFCSPLOWO2_02_FULL_66_14]|nr:MAG: hypothetical protein A3I63_04365 [Betaproteobacteria bacterium RIFCSPLOWO2_02_FULL_66_14]